MKTKLYLLFAAAGLFTASALSSCTTYVDPDPAPTGVTTTTVDPVIGTTTQRTVTTRY